MAKKPERRGRKRLAPKDKVVPYMVRIATRPGDSFADDLYERALDLGVPIGTYARAVLELAPGRISRKAILAKIQEGGQS